jgi:hypothetical protein
MNNTQYKFAKSQTLLGVVWTTKPEVEHYLKPPSWNCKIIIAFISVIFSFQFSFYFQLYIYYIIANKLYDCMLHLKHLCNDTSYKNNISGLQTAFSTVWNRRSKRPTMGEKWLAMGKDITLTDQTKQFSESSESSKSVRYELETSKLYFDNSIMDNNSYLNEVNCVVLWTGKIFSDVIMFCYPDDVWLRHFFS